MRQILAVFGAVVLAAAFSTPARAQADYGRSGLYVGAGASWALFTELTNAVEDDFDVSMIYDADASVESPFGFNMRGGYRIMSHFGAEAQFEYLPAVGVKVRNRLVDDSNRKAEEFDFWTLTANGKGYISDGRVQPFGLLGIGMGYARVKEFAPPFGGGSFVSFALRVGGGLDTWVTENVAVAFDVTYVLPFGDLNDYDYFGLSLGLKYRF